MLRSKSLKAEVIAVVEQNKQVKIFNKEVLFSSEILFSALD